MSGYAWYNSSSVVLKLPKSLTDIQKLAQVYIHEVGHNLNLRHTEMMKWWDIPVDFIEAGYIEVKTQKPKKSSAEKTKIKHERNLLSGKRN